MITKHYTNTNFRIDSFLVWGHGIKNLETILEIISSKCEIIYIKKRNIANISKFVKKVYSHDYAPLWHLAAKTNYLKKTPTTVCLIVVKNFSNDWDYFGEDNFRHAESICINDLKKEIRILFNPKNNNGQISEHHVIHACDNEIQTSLLCLEFDFDIHYYRSNSSIVGAPYYLHDNYLESTIFLVDTFKLKARILYGESWCNYSHKIIDIDETPHFMALCGQQDLYLNYINKFLGGPITEFYSKTRYESIIHENYLSKDHPNKYILVRKDENNGDNYVIEDGLHRASILVRNNINKVLVCMRRK